MKLNISLLFILISVTLFSQTDVQKDILLKLNAESWEELEEMKKDLSKLLLEANSNTHPVEIVNKRVEFPEEAPFTAVFLIEETADTNEALKKRQIVYTFDLQNIKKTTLSKVRDGNLLTLNFHKHKNAKVEVIMAGNVTKTLEIESIEIAAPGQNAKQAQDLIIQISNFCTYLERN